MLRLKQLLLDCGITQPEFAGMCGWSKPYISKALQGKFPTSSADRLKADIEAAVSGSEILSAWLRERGYPIAAIWEKISNGFTAVRTRPRGMGRKISLSLRTYYNIPAMQPGDPLKIEPHKEAAMISPRAMKHFRLFRSPFVNDISDTRDIFMSEDHMFLKEMMLDTARYAGFTAVYGEVGSGKSVMRKAVVQELIGEDIKVVFPIIVDKSRITPGSLIDAVILDVSEEKPTRSLEAKTRQALRLLRNRATSGMKQVLIIEEAHLLSVSAMKALKQIYELEEGFSRLIGIILIGQPELKFLLDETMHPEMREVTRRVTCAEIAGLDGDLSRYVAHKFARINRKAEDIFDQEAFEAMSRRLADRTGRGKTTSKSYPLTVNNLVSRAMSMAVEMGEEKVTADVVMSL